MIKSKWVEGALNSTIGHSIFYCIEEDRVRPTSIVADENAML